MKIKAIKLIKRDDGTVERRLINFLAVRQLQNHLNEHEATCSLFQSIALRRRLKAFYLPEPPELPVTYFPVDAAKRD